MVKLHRVNLGLDGFLGCWRSSNDPELRYMIISSMMVQVIALKDLVTQQFPTQGLIGEIRVNPVVMAA